MTNPGFAEDCCFKWNDNGTLQKAINEHACVEIQEGTFVVPEPVIVPPNHAIRGKGMDKTTVTVNQTEWEITPFEAVIGTWYEGIKVRDLEIDGKGVATYAMGAVGMEIDSCRMKNLRCSAIGAAGPGMIVRNSEMHHIAHPTLCPAKAMWQAITYRLAWSLVLQSIPKERQAIGRQSLKITSSGTFTGRLWTSMGPGEEPLPAMRWDIIGWSAVGLYGASNWTITDNVISMEGKSGPTTHTRTVREGPVENGVQRSGYVRTKAPRRGSPPTTTKSSTIRPSRITEFCPLGKTKGIHGYAAYEHVHRQ